MSPPRQEETGDAASKLARARERNLEAQARYRRKNADAIQDLEAAVEAKQKDVSNAQDKRVHAYRHNHELHTRISHAITMLTGLARDKQHHAEQHGPQHTQRSPASSTWSLKSRLRRSIANRYSPPPETARSRSADPMSPASSSSSVEVLHLTADPIPAALSPISLLASVSPRPPPVGLCATHLPAAASMDTDQRTACMPHTRGRVVTAKAIIEQLAARLQTLREATSAADGVPVRWYLQSPWSVATGAPVSFTPALNSEASLASAYFCSVVLSMENLFLAISLDPAQALPQLPGVAPSHHGGAADADALSRRLQQEFGALRARLSSLDAAEPESITAHMACGVDGTYPVRRGVPHALVAVCCRYRKHLPRWQWLQALAAFMAVSGGTLKGISQAGEGCVHREPAGAEAGAHVITRCPRCAVAAMIAGCLSECITRDQHETVAMQPQPMCQLRERLEEVASFSALMLSQTLVEEPCLTRMCYHHELSQASIERTVKHKEDVVLAVYSRLRLTPHQQHLAAAMWHLWCERRRMHDRVFTNILCHLGHISHGGTASQPLSLEDYVAASTDWCDGGMDDCLSTPPPSPAGTLPGGLGPVCDALERLRAAHAADGDMMAEFARAVRMPGAVFLPEQLALAIPLTTFCSTTATDWLWVCRCAAEDVARQATFVGFGW